MKLFLLHYLLYFFLFVAFSSQKPRAKVPGNFINEVYRLPAFLQALDSRYFVLLNDSECVNSPDANILLRFDLKHKSLVAKYTFPELHEAASSFRILSISQDRNHLMVYGEIKNARANAIQPVFYTLSKDFKYASLRYPNNAEAPIFALPSHGFWINEDTLFSGIATNGPRKLLKGNFYRKSLFLPDSKQSHFIGNSTIQFKKLLEYANKGIPQKELPYLHFSENGYMSVYNTICNMRNEKLLFALDSSKEILNFSIDPAMGTILVASSYHNKDSAGVYQLHAYNLQQKKALYAPIRIKNEHVLKIDIQGQNFYMFGKDQLGYFVNKHTPSLH